MSAWAWDFLVVFIIMPVGGYATAWVIQFFLNMLKEWSK